MKINMKIYQQLVKLHGYRGPVTVFAVHTKNDAVQVLRRLNPEWTTADHRDLSDKFAVLADKYRKLYSTELNKAAQDAWGRDFVPSDYRVSGIGSDKFSNEHKQAIRAALRKMQQYKILRDAHELAFKYGKKARAAAATATVYPLSYQQHIEHLITQSGTTISDDVKQQLRQKLGANWSSHSGIDSLMADLSVTGDSCRTLVLILLQINKLLDDMQQDEDDKLLYDHEGLHALRTLEECVVDVTTAAKHMLKLLKG